jgi:hypothetical protein
VYVFVVVICDLTRQSSQALPLQLPVHVLEAESAMRNAKSDLFMDKKIMP